MIETRRLKIVIFFRTILSFVLSRKVTITAMMIKIILIIVIITINIPFQPSDFSTGFTTAQVHVVKGIVPFTNIADTFKVSTI